MENAKNNFGYILAFNERLSGVGNLIKHHYVYDFAAAQTAEEAVDNLAKVLEGSIPFKQDLDKGLRDKTKLVSLELMGDGKKLFKLHSIEGTESLFGLPWFKKPSLSVHWGWMEFERVDRNLLDALVKTFPEQKQIFKGKFLEDALGL
jgi:hypothetical protein